MEIYKEKRNLLFCLMAIGLIFILYFIFKIEKLKTEKLFLPEESKIKSMFVLLDGRTKKGFNFCSHEIKPYSRMNKHDCSFKLDDIEYNIRRKYIFDKKGELEEFWSIGSEGPIIYSMKELLEDDKFLESIGGKELNVKIDANKIIVNKSSFKVEKIFPMEKLVFVERDIVKKNDLIEIYEYH